MRQRILEYTALAAAIAVLACATALMVAATIWGLRVMLG